MSMLDLAANPIFSSAFGIVGSLANGVLSYFQRKQDHAFAIEEGKLKLEQMTLQGNIDQAKLAGILASDRERNAGEAFTASQVSQATAHRGARWSATLSESTRPLLTWFYQVFLLVIAACIMAGWAVESVENPILQFIIISGVNTASMTVSWWFGQRQLDKVAVQWGNRQVNARVGAPVKPS
jgi:hypothetical protein